MGSPNTSPSRQEQMFQQGRPSPGQEPKLVVQVAQGQLANPKQGTSGQMVNPKQGASSQLVQPKLSLSSFVGPEVITSLHLSFANIGPSSNIITFHTCLWVP